MRLSIYNAPVSNPTPHDIFQDYAEGRSHYGDSFDWVDFSLDGTSILVSTANNQSLSFLSKSFRWAFVIAGPSNETAIPRHRSHIRSTLWIRNGRTSTRSESLNIYRYTRLLCVTFLVQKHIIKIGRLTKPIKPHSVGYLPNQYQLTGTYSFRALQQE